MLVTLQPENLMSEFSFLYSDNFFMILYINKV